MRVLRQRGRGDRGVVESVHRDTARGEIIVGYCRCSRRALAPGIHKIWNRSYGDSCGRLVVQSRMIQVGLWYCPNIIRSCIIRPSRSMRSGQCSHCRGCSRLSRVLRKMQEFITCTTRTSTKQHQLVSFGASGNVVRYLRTSASRIVHYSASESGE